MKPVDVKECRPSSNLFDRCYRITNEKLHQIIQTTSGEGLSMLNTAIMDVSEKKIMI